MARAWLFSSVLHVALAALLYFGLPSLSRPPPAMEQAITVELVNEAPDLQPEPPAPAPAATAPKPQQRAASPNPEPTPPPEPKVEPKPAPEPKVEPKPAPAPQQAEAPPEPKPEPAPPPPPAVQPAPEPEPPAKPAIAEAPPPPEPEPAPKPDAARTEPAPEPPAEPQLTETKPELPPPAPAVQPKPEPAPAPKVAARQPEPPPKPEPEPKPVAKAEPPPPASQPPAPKPQLKPPAPKLAETTPPPKPPKPEPAAPKEDAFAALLKSVEKLDRQSESDTTRAGTGRGAATEGRARNAIGEGQLSFSEIDALRRQIGSCWTLPVGVEGIDDMVVQMRIQVRPDRTVQNVEIEDQARLGRDPTFRAVAESARRAVDKCSPLILPPGKYALWRDIHLNFRPADAING